MSDDHQDALVLLVPVLLSLGLVISPLFPPLIIAIVAVTIIGVIVWAWRER